MDGVYVLQTVGKDGPEYRISEFEDVKVLTLSDQGKYVKDMNVLKTNIRRFFGPSKVFFNGEDAINYASMMLDEFKKQGVNFNNGVRIMPPMDFEF